MAPAEVLQGAVVSIWLCLVTASVVHLDRMSVKRGRVETAAREASVVAAASGCISAATAMSGIQNTRVDVDISLQAPDLRQMISIILGIIGGEAGGGAEVLRRVFADPLKTVRLRTSVGGGESTIRGLENPSQLVADRSLRCVEPGIPMDGRVFHEQLSRTFYEKYGLR